MEICLPLAGSVPVTSGPLPPGEKTTACADAIGAQPAPVRARLRSTGCQPPFCRTRTGIEVAVRVKPPSGCAVTSVVAVVSAATTTGFPLLRAWVEAVDSATLAPPGAALPICALLAPSAVRPVRCVVEPAACAPDDGAGWGIAASAGSEPAARAAVASTAIPDIRAIRSLLLTEEGRGVNIPISSLRLLITDFLERRHGNA